MSGEEFQNHWRWYQDFQMHTVQLSLHSRWWEIFSHPVLCLFINVSFDMIGPVQSDRTEFSLFTVSDATSVTFLSTGMSCFPQERIRSSEWMVLILILSSTQNARLQTGHNLPITEDSTHLLPNWILFEPRPYLDILSVKITNRSPTSTLKGVHLMQRHSHRISRGTW